MRRSSPLRWRGTRPRPRSSVWAATEPCSSIRTRAPFSAPARARTTQFFQSMTNMHRYLGATGEVPAHRPIVHRRQQPRVSRPGRHRPVHLVAETAHAAVPQADRVVSAQAGRACARFQLAQHDWFLVCDSDRDHDRQRRRHFVYVGDRSGLSPHGFARAGRARRRGAGAPKVNQRPPVIPAELDRIWARAEQQVPTWSLLSMRFPNRPDGPGDGHNHGRCELERLRSIEPDAERRLR